jgi:hypothetical protein
MTIADEVDLQLIEAMKSFSEDSLPSVRRLLGHSFA